MNANAAFERPLTAHIDPTREPLSLKEYEAVGGYAALKKALTQMQPGDVTQTVKNANLRGRGGAGFPTGVKWSLVPMGEGAPKDKYIICNADEMEPGTFKDRLLMEGNPHQLVEGMLVSAYAIQASRAYIFLRGAYTLAARRLRKAIAEATEAGYIGKNILGSGFSITLSVHTGAGRYICGEETALINSLEGKRANPRAKPPFPQIAGLWGKPTVVNNCETLCNVPHIVNNGPEWFTGLAQGRSKDGGTKLYGASGRVKHPGCWELPFGTTAREILEDFAGGMQEGLKLKCWLPGGASTDFLLPKDLDLAMDFETIGKAHSRMGTGLLTAVDDHQNILEVVCNLEEFFSHESCGWCTPCRDGLPWTVKLLQAFIHHEARAEDLKVLEEMTHALGPGRTFCAHAPGAMEPLQSALRYFRDEFEAGIAQHPAPTPAELQVLT
ncbi:MAG TPA: NADH-quinone oxidoreductase subunit NuoF [Nevskiaceae bacterium]|nr:NADH-quinone oxidoreductase subunit NuoF [Nevskiaceae bacterium]